MHDLLTRAHAALASIHPLAPWAALTLAIFAPQYAIRKWRPMWWERFALLGPEAALASKIWQGLPSVLLGATWAAFASGGDLRAAFCGALAGALAPLKHEALKRLPNSVVPYVGGSYPAASTAPRVPPPPVPPLVTFLVAFGLTFGVGQSCGGNPEVVRAPEPVGCDGGACPIRDDGGRSAGSVPADPPPELDGAPQQYGAVLVVLRVAGGVEHAIMCGGEVSTDLGAPKREPCPYDHAAPDSGRALLKLDRGDQ
jgi:hypothetical protein